MNIGSGSAYPSNSLSNFSPHPFVFDGVEVSSMEGLLQAFKDDKPHIQIETCKLVGKAAKFKGKKRNKAWKRVQKLWWMGEEFDRHGQEYQDLLDRAYQAMCDQSEGFRNALKASGKSTLTHSLGSNKASETVLTEREFCSRLMKLRDTL